MDKKKSLSAGIYNPYMGILGGGEKYLLTIARVLKADYKIVLYYSKFDQSLISRRFHIDFQDITLESDSIFRNAFSIKKLFELQKHHLFFYMTDGSLFFSPARRSYLIIQSPLQIPKLNKINRLKLNNWKIICYSKFMQKIIEEKISRKAHILSPAIDVEDFRCSAVNKKNIILSVGRFLSHPHDKNQSVLVDIFMQNYRKIFQDWKLVLIGTTVDEQGLMLTERLKKHVKGYPIEIIPNASFDTLLSYYHQAKIFWHAAGFGADLLNNPEKAEHFGIVVLEAMAAGLVPVIFNGGGLKDIVTDNINGYLWSTSRELVEKTKMLLEDKKIFSRLATQSQKRAVDFSQDRFYENLKSIIHL